MVHRRSERQAACPPNCIDHFLGQIDYEAVGHESVELPDRVFNPDYEGGCFRRSSTCRRSTDRILPRPGVPSSLMRRALRWPVFQGRT